MMIELTNTNQNQINIQNKIESFFLSLCAAKNALFLFVIAQTGTLNL
jgi:hypothetical protein